MRLFAAFAAGFLFSVGLVLGGMTRPENVVGFLDFFGSWRPALALVMAGAVGVYAALFPLIVKRRAPLFAPVFELPGALKPDRRLFIGASAFGVGWGLAGFCPGPALVVLGAGAREAAIFTAAMAAGIILYRFVPQKDEGASAGENENTCG
ncbi:MAG: DUF6691 family protein [Elusimicrobiota bacterium]